MLEGDHPAWSFDTLLAYGGGTPRRRASRQRPLPVRPDARAEAYNRQWHPEYELLYETLAWWWTPRGVWR